jgi:hypothetical protein
MAQKKRTISGEEWTKSSQEKARRGLARGIINVVQVGLDPGESCYNFAEAPIHQQKIKSNTEREDYIGKETSTHKNPTRSAQIVYANLEKGDDIFLLSSLAPPSPPTSPSTPTSLSPSLAIAAITLLLIGIVVAIGSSRARNHNGDGA